MLKVVQVVRVGLVVMFTGILFSFGAGYSQSGTLSEVTSGYSSAFAEFFEHQSSVSPDSITYALNLDRIGKPDVDFLFLRNTFYVVLDRHANIEIYLMGYFDTIEMYEDEFRLMSIDTGDLTVNEVMDALIKYYKR